MLAIVQGQKKAIHGINNWPHHFFARVLRKSPLSEKSISYAQRQQEYEVCPSEGHTDKPAEITEAGEEREH